MSNTKSNYPAPSADNQLNGTEYTGETILSLMDLSAKGKPKDTAELKQRIDDFFAFCARSSLRPGIESLCLALSVSRNTFWLWSNGNHHKGKEWTKICQTAKQTILSFLEQSMLSGHLSPPSAIFLLKNIGAYKDTISFEETASQGQTAVKITPEEIAARHGITISAENDPVEYPEPEFIKPTEVMNGF